jgi:hypothetical protein
MSAGAGLVFHGSGFYITDYGKDGKKDQKHVPGRRTEVKSGSDSGQSDSASASNDSTAGAGASESSSAAPKSESKSTADSGTPAKAATTPKAAE